MAPKSQALSDEDVRKVLELIREADSVELKLTVPAEEGFSTQTALEIDPLDAHIRQIYFFDTPDLALDRNGVVARARRIQDKGDDSVIKLRPVVPDRLPSSLRESKGFVVEVDAMPGGYVCSGSLKESLGPTDVKQAVGGDKPLRKLFSKQQRSFFAEHAPEGLEIDDLSILGPITVAKLKCSPEGYPYKLAVELWNYPDGSRILELSTRCAPGVAFQVAAETRAFLSGRGIDLTGEQQTKTRTALEFFAGALEQQAAAGT
jgi:hypothetical protein